MENKSAIFQQLKRLLIVHFVLVASAMACWQAAAEKAARAPDLASTREQITQLLSMEGRLPGHLQRVRPLLSRHYVDQTHPPYWIGTGRMTQFIQRLEFADEDGLKPSDYPADYLLALRDTVEAADAKTAAYVELTFTAFFLRYASDLITGRFVPRKIDPDLFQARPTIDLAAVLSGFGTTGNPIALLKTIEPQSPHYRALKSVLRRYRDIEDKGGWPTIPSGPVLKPGMHDPRIPTIRERLTKSGDLTKGQIADAAFYDDALALATASYQRRHGLNDEAIIGKLTLTQFNVPVAERIRQIIVNMERWRWMPADMGNRHIMVNIAAFELQRVNSGSVIERIPVVVGKTYHQTPVFSDELEYLEFNPTWTAPKSISVNEFLPRLKDNPFALGPTFELLAQGTSVPFGSVNFMQYSGGNFPFTIRQKPGPKNALGQVKFMLPNRHAVYLHDTPSRSLFARKTRAFSHGCVRVYQPIRMAEKILADVPGWTSQRIANVLASGKTTRVNLPEHIPVHLIYATAFRGEGGSVEFRSDIYGRDRKLYNALFAKPTS